MWPKVNIFGLLALMPLGFEVVSYSNCFSRNEKKALRLNVNTWSKTPALLAVFTKYAGFLTSLYTYRSIPYIVHQFYMNKLQNHFQTPNCPISYAHHSDSHRIGKPAG